MLKFFDCFAGIGGFHLAIDNMETETLCIGACEYEKHLIELYERNFGIRPHKDVVDLDAESIEDHDLLCGGFPCQPFSTYNTVGRRGFDHQKGNLFDELLEILKVKQPQYFLFENVRGLKFNKDVYKYIIESIRKCDYHLTEYTLSPHQFGIPQHRPRIFIFGSKKPIKTYLLPVKSVRNRTCVNSIRSYLKFAIEEYDHYFVTGHVRDELDRLIESGRLNEHNREDLYLTKRFRPVPIIIRHLDIGICDAFLTGISKQAIIYDPIINEWRRLSVRESARMQSFPNSFKFPAPRNKSYTAIGNAVNSTVVQAILDAHILGKSDKEFYSIQQLLF